MTDLDLPSVESPYQGQRLRRRDHLAFSAFWFGVNFLWGAMLVIVIPDQVPRIVSENQVVWVGFILGFGAIASMLIPLISGPLSDRCASRWGRRRPYIASGIVINVIGLAMMFGAAELRNIWLYALAFFIVQLGNNWATGPYSGLIPDVVPRDQRGIASGWMAVMSQIGTLFGGVTCGLLIEARQYLVAYAAMAIALVASGVWTLVGTREAPLPVRPPRLLLGRYVRSLWIDPRKHPNFAWVWITRALVMVGFYAPLPYLQNYLRDVVGVQNPAEQVPKLMVLILVGSALSSVYGGKLSERVGRKPVIYVANGIIVVTALLFPFCRDLSHVLAVGIVFGLCYGAYLSVDWALGCDVLPRREDAAKDMAVWHIAMTAPQTVATPFAGWLLASFGMTRVLASDGAEVESYAWSGHLALFVFAAVNFGLGAVLLRNVRGVR